MFRRTSRAWLKRFHRNPLPVDFVSKYRATMIGKPDDLVEILRDIEKHEDYMNNQKEHFWTIGLNSRNNMVFVDLVSLGTLNYNMVHPRETFRRAIEQGVAAIICAHNHPSDTPEFSDEDISLMKRLVQGGKLLGIDLLDFVVYAEGRIVSAKKQGLI